MINLKKKIELSNILEKIEVDGHSLENIELLDNLHSKPKSHVLGITGPPGAGKSSLIDKLIAIIRKKKKDCRGNSHRSIVFKIWWCIVRRQDEISTRSK